MRSGSGRPLGSLRLDATLRNDDNGWSRAVPAANRIYKRALTYAYAYRDGEPQVVHIDLVGKELGNFKEILDVPGALW